MINVNTYLCFPFFLLWTPIIHYIVKASKIVNTKLKCSEWTRSDKMKKTIKFTYAFRLITQTAFRFPTQFGQVQGIEGWVYILNNQGNGQVPPTKNGNNLLYNN